MPRVNDGALLFLQTMLAKMKPPEKGGSRIAIIFNGSPLSNGDCGSGESEIRRWILENDWLDAIVMLPDQLFYNTGIFTYIWLLRNDKPRRHQRPRDAHRRPPAVREGAQVLRQQAQPHHRRAPRTGSRSATATAGRRASPTSM